MKVGIMVDDWKLPIFEKRLKEEGIEYENMGSPESGVILLTLEHDDPLSLSPLMEEMNNAARRSKAH